MSDCTHEHVTRFHDSGSTRCDDCGVEGYQTKTGRILTDEDIEALADEAERGYDVSHLHEHVQHVTRERHERGD